jgi:hypothetical protein
MPFRNPKNKTISFRLSEQEYAIADQVRHKCNIESMSVLARFALLAYSHHPPEMADAELEGVKQRLDVVAHQVADLLKRFDQRLTS